jgi:dipeptidase D
MNKTFQLEPAKVWEYFNEICQIPRPSKNEGRILDYLIRFAEKNKIPYKQDSVGNLLMEKEAFPGNENLKKVILQSHLDMVGEKEPQKKHDFSKDPITPKVVGAWVQADGTTLGADDGIGIAAQMVILEDNQLKHGPLECLFTVDEESGMTGAMNLQPGFLTGKILLNLDSEDEGELFIGCAGGIDTVAKFKSKSKPVNNNSRAYIIRVSGLNGGHSGDEIHKSPANAIKILNRFLWNATSEFKIRIHMLDGGNMRNAIPREAEAYVVVPQKHAVNFESFFQIYAGIVARETGKIESGISFSIKETDLPLAVISRKIQRQLMDAIYACPHGVITWSRELEGLVETSTNLASVKMNNNREIVVTTSQRSSVDSAKKDISDRIGSIFRMAGARVEHSDGYPGWNPDPDSEIVRTTEACYNQLFRKKPIVRAIHAGLECGLIREKYPNLDMISFGPTIKGAHTPGEKINIKSTQKFWKLLLEVLKNVSSE